MTAATGDVWEVMSTARTIRRCTAEPVAPVSSPAGFPTAASSCCGKPVGVPDGWLVAGHVVIGWPKGKHGPVRRRPLADFVNLDHWDEPAGGSLTAT